MHPALLRARTNRVNVVVIFLLSYEMENMFVDITELVAGIVWSALHFVPNDVIAEYPSLFIDQTKSNTPRDAEESFILICVANI